MRTHCRHPLTAAALASLLALLSTSVAEAAQRSAPAPRGGAPRAAAPRASAPRATAPSSRTALAPRSTATRGTVPPRQTANGVARYGYGNGSYYYGGYPGYGWGYGYPYYPYYDWGWGWGLGWYGAWGGYGWPYAGATYVYAEPYPEAPSGPAVVETDVSPAKAEVILDGTSAGKAKDFNGTWDELRIEPGRHTITFRKDGYRSLTVTFDAAPGGRYVFDDQLVEGEGEQRIERTTPEPEAMPERPSGVARGHLRLRVQPADAVVYLDGEHLGTGAELASLHGALSVAQGEHVVEVVRPGYATSSRTVVVTGDRPAVLEVVLELQAP